MGGLPVQAVREVARDVFVVVHGDGEMGVANAAFVIEGKRSLVIDTMTFPEMGRQMAQAVSHRGGHVEVVLITHYHIDHLGGNAVFADARIVAHPESIRALQHLGLPVALYDHIMPQFHGRFSALELLAPTPLSEQLRLPQGGEIFAFTPARIWLPLPREARPILPPYMNVGATRPG